MSQVRFIGCLHLGHNAIAKMRGFENSDEHDDYLIKQWNKVVHKRDTIYILGDITMENSKHYYKLDQLNGRKIVVLGNHDRYQDVKELLNYVDGVAGMVDYKGCALTHSPIHVNEIGSYKYNIHAHIHNNELHEFHASDSYNDKGFQIKPTKHKYICVDAHNIGYVPMTLEEINKYF